MLVLVADQDPGYTDVIGDLLRQRSHRVVLASTAEAFQRFVTRSTAQLIIASMNLVEGPAAELVRELKRRQPTPILLVFDEAQPREIAACLDAGAENCIRKPFHPSVFAAQVEAIARRIRQPESAESVSVEVVAPGAAVVPANGTADPSESTGHGLEFDQEHKRVFYNGTNLRCSQIEFHILETMARMEGQVLPHAFLNARVWGYPNLNDGTLLQGHVSSIRRKLKNAGFSHSGIRTVHGVGYALSA